jgi:hypothetical protein
VRLPESQQSFENEDEYTDYQQATQERDPATRFDLLINFSEKYPESRYAPNIDSAYQKTMFDLRESKQYEKLLAASQRWLKTHADDLQAVGFAAESCEKLGKSTMYLEYALKLYGSKPVPQLAASIQSTYKAIGDDANYISWTEKLISYPEYAGDYGLRYLLVERYANANNMPKAVEYANQTLKVLDSAEKPDSKSEVDWRKELSIIRRACYTLLGMDAYEREEWTDAIRAFRAAAIADQNAYSWYYIGLSEWRLSQIEEAMVSFAKAELLGGELQVEAKERLEKLYRSLHNNTTVGIDKVYKKAKEALGN